MKKLLAAGILIGMTVYFLTDHPQEKAIQPQMTQSGTFKLQDSENPSAWIETDSVIFPADCP